MASKVILLNLSAILIVVGCMPVFKINMRRLRGELGKRDANRLCWKDKILLGLMRR